MFHDLRKYFCVTRIVQYLQGTLMYSKDHVKHGCTSGHGLTTRVPAQISSSSQVWKWSRSVVSDSLWPQGLYRLFHPWDFPGKNTGVGCHFLLQGIFPTQGLNPGLPHSRQMLYHLSLPKYSNKTIEWLCLCLVGFFKVMVRWRMGLPRWLKW